MSNEGPPLCDGLARPAVCVLRFDGCNADFSAGASFRERTLIFFTTHTPKGKSPGLPTEAFAKHSSNISNYPIEQRTGKASAMLKAQFARAGHIVHDGGNDDYIVVKSNWHMSRHCCNLASLVAFGRQLRVFQ